MEKQLEKILSPYKLSPKQISELKSWTMRVYFNENNRDKPWFVEDVTTQNVLEQFLTPKAPITPQSLVEVWKAIPMIKKGLGSLESKGTDAVADYLSHSDKSTKYTQGDVTLRELGKELGGITATMVNKLSDSAFEKIKSLFGNMSFDSADVSQSVKIEEKIERAKNAAAKEFSKALIKAKENPEQLRFVLSDFLSTNEIKLVDKNEWDALVILTEYDQERIEIILLEDYESDDNIFKTFQSIVSRKIFPRQSS